MFGSIACAAATFTLDHFKSATHAELRLLVRSCTAPSNIVVMSPTAFAPLQSKDKRKGIYVPKNADTMLSIPLLSDLDAYELCISILLAEAVKDSTTACIELVHVCPRAVFAEILAGRTVEETIPLSNPANTSHVDRLKLSLSYRKPLRKANSATYECIRLDALLIQLVDITLPLSKRSYLDDQPLCLRVCTEAYASEFPLIEVHGEHYNKGPSKRSYRLASPMPIPIPYSPVVTLQIVFLYNVAVSQSFFQLNGLQVGAPSSDVRKFCDHVPIFQCSISIKKTPYGHQSSGIPLSLAFPFSLVSSDLVSFYDVICTALQLAADSSHKKTPRSSSSLLENLKEAVIPHIFEGIFLRGGDIADVFYPYRSTISVTAQSKSDSTRFKAYEKILQFAGLTDTLLAAVGRSWTDLAAGSDSLQKLAQNKVLFVATFLLDMFDPYSSSAAKRNSVTYPDSTAVGTSGSPEQPSSIQRFESLNCASRVRDMLYAFSSKRHHKDAPVSCITILPIEFSLTNTLVSNRICIYTIRFCGDCTNGEDGKGSFSDIAPIVASNPELAENNRALWQFTLEEKKDTVQTMVAGPVISATHSEKSIDRVLLGCKNNAELSYADYLWLLPQVLPLPETISSQPSARDRVTAFEKSVLTVCLHDFESDMLLARGSLRLKNVTNTFVAAATSDLDVEIRLRWFYEKEFLQSVKGAEDTVTFLASCYGFLRELHPVDSVPQSTNDSINVSICGRSTTRPISVPLDPLDPPASSSMKAEATKASNCSLVQESAPDYPADLSTIEHAKAQQGERVSQDDKELRTPRLLSGRDIEIVDGTITFQFGTSQRQSVSDAARGASNDPGDEVSVLKQLVHTLRKDLERVTPKTFKQAVAASPSTYAGLEHSVSEDLRRKIGIYTGLVVNKESTAYDVCQTVAEKLDRNILAYLLVDMVKQNIQLSKELDGARERMNILENRCASNDVALSKLKALVLEQEQLLQYMEVRSKKEVHKSSDSTERLAAIEKENARLTELLQAIATSLSKDSAGKAISVSRNPVVHSRAHSSPLLDDGRSGVLLSVKLPPGRLPPLSPDSKALSS